ncbi:MCC1 [Symbiodinium sp. KB8]|nr:MCC1 [Symbiodinium sp. KB8]
MDVRSSAETKRGAEMRLVSSAADHSRSLALSASAPTLAFTESQAALRANELANRKELWNLRADIEKEKLRHVAPFPFFGRAMRFQDKFAALQITDDGRFSYSFVGLNHEGCTCCCSSQAMMSSIRRWLHRCGYHIKEGVLQSTSPRSSRVVSTAGLMASASPSFPPECLAAAATPPLRAVVHEKLRQSGGLEGLGGLASVHFRPLKKEDRKELEQLHHEWFPVAYPASFYDEVFQSRTVQSLAAIAGDILLGAATFRTTFAEPRFDMTSVLQGGLRSCMEGYAGYILTLGVVDGARGHGLAKALLQQSIKRIKAVLPKVQAIWVHVACYNQQAKALYESQGLQLVRCFPRFYSFYNKSWDSLLYVLYINGGKPPDSLPLQVVQDEIAATLSCHSTLLAEYHYGPIRAQASLSFLKAWQDAAAADADLQGRADGEVSVCQEVRDQVVVWEGAVEPESAPSFGSFTGPASHEQARSFASGRSAVVEPQLSKEATTTSAAADLAQFRAERAADVLRLRYCTRSVPTASFEKVDVEDSEPVLVEDDPKSRVRTYEGILVSTLEEEPLEPVAELEPEGTATIQGLAMLRHEIEEVGGRARLVNVIRSSSRFAIVVSPYFQPNMAVVHSLHLSLSPRRPRRTQLPFVGSGTKRDARASTMKSGDIWRLTQERRRAPKPKFSKSGSTGMLPAAAPSPKPGDTRQSMFSKPSNSMPQLPALVDKKDKKDGKARELTTVSDWRDFYKQRAQELSRPRWCFFFSRSVFLFLGGSDEVQRCSESPASRGSALDAPGSGLGLVPSPVASVGGIRCTPACRTGDSALPRAPTHSGPKPYVVLPFQSLQVFAQAGHLHLAAWHALQAKHATAKAVHAPEASLATAAPLAFQRLAYELYIRVYFADFPNTRCCSAGLCLITRIFSRLLGFL